MLECSLSSVISPF